MGYIATGALREILRSATTANFAPTTATSSMTSTTVREEVAPRIATPLIARPLSESRTLLISKAPTAPIAPRVPLAPVAAPKGRIIQAPAAPRQPLAPTTSTPRSPRQPLPPTAPVPRTPRQPVAPTLAPPRITRRPAPAPTGKPPRSPGPTLRPAPTGRRPAGEPTLKQPRPRPEPLDTPVTNEPGTGSGYTVGGSGGGGGGSWWTDNSEPAPTDEELQFEPEAVPEPKKSNTGLIVGVLAAAAGVAYLIWGE